MGAIVDFFAGLIDTIVALVNFVINTLMDLIYMIGLLGQMLVNIPAYFGWLPSAISSSVIVIFSFVIIFKILGREG